MPISFPYQLVKWMPESQLNVPGAVVTEVIRPWIDIELFNPLTKKHTGFLCSCLVDTGSDATFFNEELGQYLGYDIGAGEYREITGVGGGSVKAYFHEVGIRVNNPVGKEKPIDIVDSMGFVPGGFPISNPQQTGILGSVGFFRYVNVYFSYPRLIQISINSNLN